MSWNELFWSLVYGMGYLLVVIIILAIVVGIIWLVFLYPWSLVVVAFLIVLGIGNDAYRKSARWRNKR